MVEISNTKVYNLEESVIASGNAMRVKPLTKNHENINSSIERCKKLSSYGGGTGHTNFRTGILVSFDIKYPQYFTKQLQRYHWVQYVSSTSVMHSILKMNIDNSCNKYVSDYIKVHISKMIEYYNKLSENSKDTSTVESYLNYCDMVGYKCVDTNDLLYDCYMKIISDLPMGLELIVHVVTNYEQLATIYKQRKNHKLKEDWGAFCQWIESLPYSKELILV